LKSNKLHDLTILSSLTKHNCMEYRGFIIIDITVELVLTTLVT